MEFLRRFDWTDTLLIETKKQALEVVPVEYHDLFARHRKDIGMNKELKVKVLPKDDRVLYSQTVPMQIHLKEDSMVEFALMHKYEIITVVLFSKYASPIFVQRKLNGKPRLLVDLRKINTLIADDITNDNHPVSTLSDAAQKLQVNFYSASLTAPKLVTAWKWRTNVQWKCSHSNLPAEVLPAKDSHMVSEDLCLLFRASCADTWIQLLRVKADQCAQYVDDIGIAAKNATDLTRNIRAVF